MQEERDDEDDDESSAAASASKKKKAKKLVKATEPQEKAKKTKTKSVATEDEEDDSDKAKKIKKTKKKVAMEEPASSSKKSKKKPKDAEAEEEEDSGSKKKAKKTKKRKAAAEEAEEDGMDETPTQEGGEAEDGKDEVDTEPATKKSKTKKIKKAKVVEEPREAVWLHKHNASQLVRKLSSSLLAMKVYLPPDATNEQVFAAHRQFVRGTIGDVALHRICEKAGIVPIKVVRQRAIEAANESGENVKDAVAKAESNIMCESVSGVTLDRMRCGYEALTNWLINQANVETTLAKRKSICKEHAETAVSNLKPTLYH